MRRSAPLTALLTVCVVASLGPGCGGPPQPRVAAIDLQASGGGPLLITALGGTLQLAPLAVDAAAQPVGGAALLFTSADPGVASVDATGLVTGVANGTAVLSAAAGSAVGRATVTIAQAPDSVAVVPASASVARGASVAFSASAVDSRGHAIAGAAIVWDTGAPSVATVSTAGVAAGLAVGTTLVVAHFGAKSGSASLAVAIPATAALALDAAVTGALTSLDATRQLQAAARDAHGAPIPDAVFAWSSSDPAVATVDASGLVTARKNGPATVAVTSGDAHASLDLVVAQAATSVALSPATQSIGPGTSFTFTALPLDAHGHPVATPLPAPAFTIDDGAVAGIDAATGQVTANPGATAIASTFLHAAIGALSGTARLTVDPAMAPVVSVALPPPTAALASLGATVQLSATAINAAGNPVPGVAFSWSSDHPAVAGVDASTGLVTARSNGAANLTASGGGRSATVVVSVSQVAAALVLASPAASTLTSLEDALQLLAAVEDARGNAVASAVLAWSTSDAAVATVGNTGLVTARGNGVATIAAASGALHGQVDLTVAQAVHAVALSPADEAVAPHTALAYRAAAVDAHGHLVPGAPLPSWSSSDPLHAAIDSITGQASIGAVDALLTVSIRATIGGQGGATPLTIDPGLSPVAQVVIAGGGVSLGSLGDGAQLSAAALDSFGHPLARSIAWSVQDQSTDVVTVGATGLVTAVRNGQKVIVASTGGVSGTALVTVAQVLASVRVATSLFNAPLVLTSLGDTLALQATGFDARNHAISGGVFGWRSDSANLAIDQSGVVTAVANGGALLFARSGAIESAPGFAVAVAQAVDRIAVSAGPAQTTLTSVGDTLQLAASAFDARNHPVAATFAWSPAAGAACTVDAASGLVTAAFNGITSVQAAAGGKSGAIAVTVAQVVASVAVTGTATLASLGETTQLSAVARDARGHLAPVTGFTWRSTATSVATVDAGTGLASAVGNGSTLAIASAAGVESPGYPLTVAQVIATIAVTGAASLAPGQTSQLTATALDARQNPLAGIRFAWSVQDGSANVVTVGPSGLVTAVGRGQKNVVAGAHGRSGVSTVVVG